MKVFAFIYPNIIVGRKACVMDNTKNTAVIEVAPEFPITLQEYADQYDVCPKTVEQWFEHGRKITTVNLNFSDLNG